MEEARINPFTDILHLVDAAENSISDLQLHLDEFMARHPARQLVETDTTTGEILLKLKFADDIPFPIKRVVGSIATELKSALDQGGYAAATLAGIENPRRAHFPFGEKIEDFNGVIKGKCRDLPPTIIDLFRACRAYKGGDNLLWSLSDMSNCIKHRYVSFSTASVSDLNIEYMRTTHGATLPGWPLRYNRARKEIVVLKFPPGSRLEARIQVRYCIAFDSVGAVGNEEVADCLRKLVPKVRDIIVRTEAECKRLGLLT